MSQASQVLPSLVFLVVGSAGFLWLSEPTTVGAAGKRALEPARMAAPASRASGSAPAASEMLAKAASPARRASQARPAAGTPAHAFSAEELDDFRRRAEEQKEARRRAVQLRREREEDAWFVERSGQVVAELALPASSAARLADVLINERDRQSALWEALRERGPTLARRQELRDEMREIRALRNQELVSLFGEELAPRVEALVDGAEAPAK